jgi:hypothetical protein
MGAIKFIIHNCEYRNDDWNRQASQTSRNRWTNQNYQANQDAPLNLNLPYIIR